MTDPAVTTPGKHSPSSVGQSYLNECIIFQQVENEIEDTAKKVESLSLNVRD